MTPLDLLAWAGTIAACVVIACVAVAVVVDTVRAFRNPKRVGNLHVVPGSKRGTR